MQLKVVYSEFEIHFVSLNLFKYIILRELIKTVKFVHWLRLQQYCKKINLKLIY